MPVLLAWEGTASIVNPTLAGGTKRKTDVLDASLLALHDVTGVWKESYIPSREVTALRALISEREKAVNEAASIGNRINNLCVRFGITVGRCGSVVKSTGIRSTIESLVSDEAPIIEGVCPIPLPPDIRAVISDAYRRYDLATARAGSLLETIRGKALSMSWETDCSVISGQEMVGILTSAPQIGDITAITWLAHIITPRRFQNSKALAAYCGLDPSFKVSAGKVTSAVKRGGCKELHNKLASAGDRLIRSHSELFGKWGYNLYSQTGKWKKAANAVARKLAVSLYYMMKTGQPFSYEKYSLVKNIGTFNIPIDELPSLNHDFKRYVRILKEHGIQTTDDMVAAYLLLESLFSLLFSIFYHHFLYFF